MKVLYVAHRFPYPPTHGGKIRAFNTIRHLARDHRVTVASLVFSEQEAEEGRGLADYSERVVVERVHRPLQGARMVARLASTVPSTMGYFHSPRLATRIRELIRHERFDLIVVHCSSVAHYVAHAASVPRMLDFVDMDSQKWLDYARFKPFPLSAGYRLEGAKLQAAERALARRFDMSAVTTQAELDTLESFGTGAAADWFANGVDTDYFSPTAQPIDPDLVCFVGRMNYYPNERCMVEFCRDVLPLLRAARPTVRLAIVGADPTPAVRRLAALPGVSVTGSVPDVRPHVRRAAVVVAPLGIARGVQNKILEAMALGAPVVASTIAARGVDAVAGEHLLAAGDPRQTADAVLALLGDAGMRRCYAEAGRARMLSHHTWAHCMSRFDDIVERCIAEHGRRSGAPAGPVGYARSPSAATRT